MMGDVAVSMKIMPESVETDIEKLKEEISKKIEIKDSQVETIAFGLKALKILVVIPDKGVDQLKDDISKIDGISEVEIESSSIL
jgi:elongation factor 1-beta